MNRRSFLTAAAVASLPVSVTFDPVLAAINAFKSGVDAFNASDDALSDELEHLWLDPYDSIISMNDIATTKEGALSALRLAISEDAVGDSQAVQPLLKAALGYFENA